MLVPLSWMYQSPFDGRKTPMSARPSPSKSPRTGLSVARPNCPVVRPPSELRLRSQTPRSPSFLNIAMSVLPSPS